jgi:hypothetical protein
VRRCGWLPNPALCPNSTPELAKAPCCSAPQGPRRARGVSARSTRVSASRGSNDGHGGGDDARSVRSMRSSRSRKSGPGTEECALGRVCSRKSGPGTLADSDGDAASAHTGAGDWPSLSRLHFSSPRPSYSASVTMSSTCVYGRATHATRAVPRSPTPWHLRGPDRPLQARAGASPAEPGARDTYGRAAGWGRPAGSA